MNKIFNHIYSISPIFLQNLIVSTYGYYWKQRRYGGVFKNKIAEFNSRENYSKQQWYDYQTLELRKLLVHSFNTVHYYNQIYKKHGFNQSKFEKFEINQLNKLPYLEKETLRKFGTTSLLSKSRKKGAFYSSSGSTGTPVKIYFSQEFHQIWNAAYEVRVRNWAGVNYKMSRGMIGGRKIIPSGKVKPPYYRYNIAEKQTYFSAYHISMNNLKSYLNGIINNNVEYMVGYAMSNYFLADLIDNSDMKAPKLKAVLTSSEKLTNEMRSTFERAYGCRTFDAYSGVEACGLISENQMGDFLFSPDTGIMEVLDDNGYNVNFGETGEIIATGLLNYDQPLIRYRIGDMVKLSENQQTKSGLEMLKIDEISGRVEDVVIGKDGRRMVRFHGVFIDIPYLKVAQIVQKDINRIDLNIVVDKNFSDDSKKIMADRVINQLGDVTVEFNFLNEIPKNKNGKFQAVISKLKKS